MSKKDSATGSKLTFKFAQTKNLTSFLRKFIVIDSTAVLELTTDHTLRIKSFTASRGALKVGHVKLEDIFDYDPSTDSIEENIKIGIYSVETLIKTIDLFENNDLQLEIFYEKDKDKELQCKTFILNDGETKIETNCASKTLFRYMPEKIVTDLFNVTEFKYKFELDHDTIVKIQNITSLQKSEDDLGLIIEGEEDDYYLEFKGKNFTCKHMGEVEVEDATDPIHISKDYLKFLVLDKETYVAYATENSLILISKDSEIKVCLGRTIDNDSE